MMVDQRNFFLLNRVLLFGLCSLLTACNVNDAVPVTTNSGKNAENQNNENQNKQNSCQDGDQKAGCACDDGDTGFQVCADGEFDDQCICEGQQDLNLCGGTSKLTYEGEEVIDLDQSCGPCNDGTLVCNGQESLDCDGASDASVCLPTGSVELTASHSGEGPWDGNWQASVFLLKDFSRTCLDALDELNRPELLRPLSNIIVNNARLDLSFDGVPVGVEYTMAVVLHTTIDDKIVSTSVGCADVLLENDGQVLELKGEDELLIYDLPAQLAETYQLQLLQKSPDGGGGFFELLAETAEAIRYDTNSFGDAFLGCLTGSGNCETSGTLGHIYEMWDRIAPHKSTYEGDLRAQINHINQAARAIHDDHYTFWQFVRDIWNTQWNHNFNGGSNIEEFYLGAQILSSLSSIQIDTTSQRRFHNTPEKELNPFPLAYQQSVNYSIDEISIHIPLSNGCHRNNGNIDLEHNDCVSKTLTSQNTPWLTPSGEVTLQSHGWQHILVEEAQLSLPIGELVGEIVDTQINRMVTAVGLASLREFFSAALSCTSTRAELHTVYANAKNNGHIDYTENQLNQLTTSFYDLCQRLYNHGDALYRATILGALFEENPSAAQSVIPFTLYTEGQTDRYLLNETFSAVPGARDWEAPGLISATDATSNNCKHELLYSPLYRFSMCTYPTLQLPD